MLSEIAELDRMQQAYKEAVEKWIDAIRKDQSLASKNCAGAAVDRWKQSHSREQEARKRARAAKREYEAALRDKFYSLT